MLKWVPYEASTGLKRREGGIGKEELENGIIKIGGTGTPIRM